MSETSYSAVIATRNRAAALSLSLPLLAIQTRPPEQILIVDSSDDPSPNRLLVEQFSAETDVPIRHLTSCAGSAKQRNVGLDQVSTDVVLFPDDDSLVFPDAMAFIMRVYDRDVGKKIGGVCSAEALHPPAEAFIGSAKPAYQMRTSDRLKARLSTVRRIVEERLFPDPYKRLAWKLHDRLPPLDPWLKEESAFPVEWMTGFRMSFRTEIIKAIRFHELLGEYALHEDNDASLRVLRTHRIIATDNARIYHHKVPTRRASGREMGAINILNKAYIVLRTGEADDRIQTMLRRHCRLKLVQYTAGVNTRFGADRLIGAYAAYSELSTLFAAKTEELDSVYLSLREKCIATPRRWE